jgi:hypothetical protein
MRRLGRALVTDRIGPQELRLNRLGHQGED